MPGITGFQQSLDILDSVENLIIEPNLHSMLSVDVFKVSLMCVCVTVFSSFVTQFPISEILSEISKKTDAFLGCGCSLLFMIFDADYRLTTMIFCRMCHLLLSSLYFLFL